MELQLSGERVDVLAESVLGLRDSPPAAPATVLEDGTEQLNFGSPAGAAGSASTAPFGYCEVARLRAGLQSIRARWLRKLYAHLLY